MDAGTKLSGLERPTETAGPLTSHMARAVPEVTKVAARSLDLPAEPGDSISEGYERFSANFAPAALC